jgi:hypothetical protein
MKDKYITITTTLVEPSVAVFALPRVALALFAPIVVVVFDTSTAAADLLARVDFGALHSSQSSVSSEFSEKVQTLQAQDVCQVGAAVLIEVDSNQRPEAVRRDALPHERVRTVSSD